MDIKKQIEETLTTFPELTFHTEKSSFTGKLKVCHNDYYNVKINISPWNNNFPWVTEIGERIPHDLDRHVFTTTGNFCFTTPRLEEIYLKTKVKTLVQFIKFILIPYLQNNSYYELHKTYKYGEFAHTNSTLQTYQTLLGVKDLAILIKTIGDYLQGHRLTDKHACYCGSNKTFRKCNNGTDKLGYLQLQHICTDNLKLDLLILLGEFKEQHKTNPHLGVP